MGLNAVLVDQARTVRRVAGPRIGGRSSMTELLGPLFRARLFLDTASAPETEDTNRGRRKTVPRPTLMCGVADLAGDPLDVKASDELDVFSAELGNARWRITEDPKPIRKKRRVIGMQLMLERMAEPARQPGQVVGVAPAVESDVALPPVRS
jgi:hypothetical protein